MMSNYRFQTALIRRMYGIGFKRLCYHVGNVDESKQVMQAKNRAAVRLLVTNGIVKIKPIRRNTRRAGMQHARAPNRKACWMRRIRSLRGHWQRIRSSFRGELSEPQLKACRQLRVDTGVIESNPKLAYHRACKAVYRLIGLNRVKNRAYLCKRLGVTYDEIREKKG